MGPGRLVGRVCRHWVLEYPREPGRLTQGYHGNDRRVVNFDPDDDFVGSDFAPTHSGRGSVSSRVGLGVWEPQCRRDGRLAPGRRRAFRADLPGRLPPGPRMHHRREPGHVHLPQHQDRRYLRDRGHVRAERVVRLLRHAGDLTLTPTAAIASSLSLL